MTRPVLIVAHGQPSDPGPAEAGLARLAERVAAHAPGRRIAAATLAQPGGLAAAVQRMGSAGLVYPLFMAGGWFTRVNLPARLAEAGARGWQVLEPLGCDPALHDLAVRRVCEAQAAGKVSSVILAAHGSFRSTVPAAIARHVAARIAEETGLARVEAAFIDQEPRLAGVKGHGADALCLPFFAAEGGHVGEDIPAALAEAGFTGRLLPAIGLDPDLPLLIAAALRAEMPVCDGACRWA